MSEQSPMAGGSATAPEPDQPATKREYLRRLSHALRGCTRQDRKSAVAYYEEIIGDLTEGGMSEAEAIAGMESPEAAAASIAAELPAVPRAIARTRRYSDPVFWFLAIVGSPMWVSVLLVVAACVASVYVVIWAAILVVWVFVATGVAVGVFAVVTFAWALVRGLVPFAFMILGIGLVFAAVGLLLVIPAFAVTKWLGSWSYRFLARFFGLFFKSSGKRKNGMKPKPSDAVNRPRRGVLIARFCATAGVLLMVGVTAFLGGYAASGFDISTLNQKLPIGAIRIGPEGTGFTV